MKPAELCLPLILPRARPTIAHFASEASIGLCYVATQDSQGRSPPGMMIPPGLCEGYSCVSVPRPTSQEHSEKLARRLCPSHSSALQQWGSPGFWDAARLSLYAPATYS